MLKIKGISQELVDALVERTNSLSQGRNAGCIGFVNGDGVIDEACEIVDGGISGLPLRQLLDKITAMEGLSVVEGMAHLPVNAVVVTTRPGHTGLITDVSGVDFFNLPVVSIGVKHGEMAGAGVVYPEGRLFDLATQAELVDIRSLAANSMEEEKEVLRSGMELTKSYLEISQDLTVMNLQSKSFHKRNSEPMFTIPKLQVKSISQELAEELVNRSMTVGQGREVATIAVIKDGHVEPRGKVVDGGMGYVPSRLLASSGVNITGKSLRQLYTEDIAQDAVIVHTHPGGTGVMHMGDANAGPGTWGRPIIAIGHDKDGQVKGATVIEATDRLHSLADEDEALGQQFFTADTPEQEADIRNRKFGIAQEYTSLCKPIEIR